MQKLSWVVLGVVLVFGLVCGSAIASASKATDDLKSTIDSVVSLVKDDVLKKDALTRRKKIREAIGKRFSYQQMVMRSLAQNWDVRTPKEKEDFLELFKKLLENSYASKIESYSDEIINYVGEVVKGNYAEVKTEILRKDGVIGVDYRMILENDQWMVYDFVIADVSIIRNYRSQFSRIISKDSFQELVRKLSSKIEELELKEGKEVSEQL